MPEKTKHMCKISEPIEYNYHVKFTAHGMGHKHHIRKCTEVARSVQNALVTEDHKFYGCIVYSSVETSPKGKKKRTLRNPQHRSSKTEEYRMTMSDYAQQQNLMQ